MKKYSALDVIVKYDPLTGEPSFFLNNQNTSYITNNDGVESIISKIEEGDISKIPVYNIIFNKADGKYYYLPYTTQLVKSNINLE